MQDLQRAKLIPFTCFPSLGYSSSYLFFSTFFTGQLFWEAFPEQPSFQIVVNTQCFLPSLCLFNYLCADPFLIDVGLGQDYKWTLLGYILLSPLLPFTVLS